MGKICAAHDKKRKKIIVQFVDFQEYISSWTAVQKMAAQGSGKSEN